MLKCINFIVVLILFNCSKTPTAVEPNNELKIPGNLYSNSVQDTFKIYLDLPKNYTENNTEFYPLIILLDADWYFDGSHYRLDEGGLIGITHQIQIESNFPEVILLGIGYPSTNHRQRDFLYRSDQISQTSGGGETFYKFIKDELIPLIDKNYRTEKENRMLIGHSYGGYFTMFSLFKERNNEQRIFTNYLAISPATYYHNRYLFNKELQQYLEINDELDVKLYMSVGNLEWDKMMDSFKDMTIRINSRNHTRFKFKSVIYTNKDHGSVVKPSLYDGLVWMFK